MKPQYICVEKVHHSDHKEYHDIHDHKKHDSSKRKALRAAFFTKKLWPPNSTIKVKFMEKNPQVMRTPEGRMDTNNGPIDPLQQYFFDNPDINLTDVVKKIVKERIEPLTNLKFVFVENSEDSDMRISFDPDRGAWSLVGTDCKKEDKNEATMNLGWFDVATVIHEFGHVLGMIHEHQNPRGKTISWDDKAVFKWANETQGWDEETTKKNILDKYDKNSINGSTFDPLSIMLYFFPGDLTTNNEVTHQNLRLSGLDVEYIGKNYKANTENIGNIYSSIYNDSKLDKNIKKARL